MVIVLAALLTLVLAPAPDLARYQPSSADVAAAYRRADTIAAESRAKAAMLALDAWWTPDSTYLNYRRDEFGGEFRFVRVEMTTGKKSPLFDHAKLAGLLAAELGRPTDPDRLPFRSIGMDKGVFLFTISNQRWRYDEAAGTLEKENPPPPPTAQGGRILGPNVPSPNGKMTFAIREFNVHAGPVGGELKAVTTDGTAEIPYVRPRWSPDSQKIIAFRLTPGERKKVYRLQLSPPDNGPSRLMEDVYDRPGDIVDTHAIVTIDPATGQKVESGVIDYGGVPNMRASRDGKRMIYPVMDRGYGRWRIMALDPATGTTKTIVDDDPQTFVDSTSKIYRPLQQTDEIVFSSERSGWHHLFLSDGQGGIAPITQGEWVVRGITSIDEARRQIVFSASGMNPGEDPYFIHFYRIGFDGKNLVPLTPAKGHHAAQFSPDGRFFVDTYSTVIDPQVHELRSAETGALIAPLEKADVAPLLGTGWKPAQPFVAKGRDGKTDIYGIVYRPSNFDPTKKYPVVEDIYAGPQDSFVRKSYSVSDYDQSIAELGFIVVKIDGMGTRNRSKAFHDVCYRDLKDAGFRDRILWMQSLAKTEPSMDLERVGIFGTSAGGQNAGGAVLFHPEFYKVAIASCGCHDNRLDKIWWNEQWMGLIGPHYGASSNIDNAARLKGRLMLIVGELDSNVPPESTHRFAAALQAANKEFEFVIIPNANHTAGGPYGERKRRDFLVRHLLGVEPPNPN